jgi:hypothetical protein
MRRSILIIAGVVLLCGVVSAMGQESRSEISLQGTGFFTKDTTAGVQPNERRRPGDFWLGIDTV